MFYWEEEEPLFEASGARKPRPPPGGHERLGVFRNINKLLDGEDGDSTIPAPDMKRKRYHDMGEYSTHPLMSNQRSHPRFTLTRTRPQGKEITTTR
jgi:hypothetical protein